VEETTKKKRNCALIILWIMNILLIATVISLDIKIDKVNNSKVSDYRFGLMQNNFDNLKYPKFEFVNGIQKIDDKIMVSIENIEKYLDGYKIKIGVLNTSPLTFDLSTLYHTQNLNF